MDDRVTLFDPAVAITGVVPPFILQLLDVPLANKRGEENVTDPPPTSTFIVFEGPVWLDVDDKERLKVA